MDILHMIVSMVVMLGVLVAFHEYGHFWVARRCGVKVLRFSVGFGTPLIKWRDKLDTEYVIAALPLGGYVKMLDEREAEVAEHEKHLAFNYKPVQQRIAIVAAGPIANFLLAILVYWLVFLNGVVGLAPLITQVDENSIAEKAGLSAGWEIVAVDGEETSTKQAVALRMLHRIGETGVIKLDAKQEGTDYIRQFELQVDAWLGDEVEEVDLFDSLGVHFYRPKIEIVIDKVYPSTPAEKAGLLSGDRIVEVDGQSISDWQEWVDYVQARPEVDIELLIERKSQALESSESDSAQLLSAAITEHRLTLRPKKTKRKGKVIGQAGVSPVVDDLSIPDHLLRKQEYSVFSAWLPALDRTYQAVLFTFSSVKKMIFGDISYKQLSGPITIAKVASESAYSGIYSFLSMLALLSVSLGVLNLLPIPVLDGGHIVFYCIEWIQGKPVPEQIQNTAYWLGLLIVLSIMSIAFVNDIGRL